MKIKWYIASYGYQLTLALRSLRTYHSRAESGPFSFSLSSSWECGLKTISRDCLSKSSCHHLPLFHVLLLMPQNRPSLPTSTHSIVPCLALAFGYILTKSVLNQIKSRRGYMEGDSRNEVSLLISGWSIHNSHQTLPNVEIMASVSMSPRCNDAKRGLATLPTSVTIQHICIYYHSAVKYTLWELNAETWERKWNFVTHWKHPLV